MLLIRYINDFYDSGYTFVYECLCVDVLMIVLCIQLCLIDILVIIVL